MPPRWSKEDNLKPVLVFAIGVTVIAVFTATVTGVSTVLTVKRPHADDCQVTGDAARAETELGSSAQNHHQAPTQSQS